jgi:prevent-host-death family protein
MGSTKKSLVIAKGGARRGSFWKEQAMSLLHDFPLPRRVEEPKAVDGYAKVLRRVAAEHQPVIVQRHGADLAAVIPLDHLEIHQEVLARQENEKLAAQIDWAQAVKAGPPPQQWFDDVDHPFEAKEETVP